MLPRSSDTMKPISLSTLFAFCILLAFPIISPSQNIPEKIFEHHGERYVQLRVADKSQLIAVGQIASIDFVDGERVIAVVNRESLERLILSGIPFELLPSPGEGFTAAMSEKININAPQEWNSYPTYEAFEDLMNQFAINYPQLCQIVNIGTLASGRKLLGARITSSQVESGRKPQFLYSSGMHGDETGGYVLSIRFINYLLSEYARSPRIRRLVDSIETWIFPLANPDGTYKAGNHTVTGATRFNANNVDLNRNYPDPRVGQFPGGPWQPETLAFMTLANEQHFSMGANLHGGTEVCNFPWDTWSEPTADQNWWIEVCREYADTAQYYSPEGYFTFMGGVTNGAEWYVISGGRQDYMNYFHHCREMTIEISTAKLYPSSLLPVLWENNYRSLTNYLERSLLGLKGIVSDAVTGKPVKARITIEGHDTDNSFVYSHPDHGGYSRYLAPGDYELTFEAPCFQPIKKTVSLSRRSSVIVDVQMNPVSPRATIKASSTAIGTGEAVNFLFATCDTTTDVLWRFDGGSPSTSSALQPKVTYAQPGIYDVSITLGGSQGHITSIPAFIHVGNPVNISNATLTTCQSLFYDSGGPLGAFLSNENYIMTFMPGQSGQTITANFKAFFLSQNSECSKVALKIFDGTDTSAPLIGMWCGSESPGVVRAANSSGSLTFQFSSSEVIPQPGWAAVIDCTPKPVGWERNNSFTTAIEAFPNPNALGNLTVKVPAAISMIKLYNSTGKNVYTSYEVGNEFNIPTSNLPAGLYIIEIRSGKQQFCKKIQVIR